MILHPKCGKQNTDNSKFCRQCGTRIEVPAASEQGVLKENSSSINSGTSKDKKKKWMHIGTGSSLAAAAALSVCLLAGCSVSTSQEAQPETPDQGLKAQTSSTPAAKMLNTQLTEKGQLEAFDVPFTMDDYGQITPDELELPGGMMDSVILTGSEDQEQLATLFLESGKVKDITFYLYDGFDENGNADDLFTKNSVGLEVSHPQEEKITAYLDDQMALFITQNYNFPFGSDEECYRETVRGFSLPSFEETFELNRTSDTLFEGGESKHCTLKLNGDPVWNYTMVEGADELFVQDPETYASSEAEFLDQVRELIGPVAEILSVEPFDVSTRFQKLQAKKTSDQSILQTLTYRYEYDEADPMTGTLHVTLNDIFEDTGQQAKDLGVLQAQDHSVREEREHQEEESNKERVSNLYGFWYDEETELAFFIDERGVSGNYIHADLEQPEEHGLSMQKNSDGTITLKGYGDKEPLGVLAMNSYGDICLDGRALYHTSGDFRFDLEGTWTCDDGKIEFMEGNGYRRMRGSKQYSASYYFKSPSEMIVKEAERLYAFHSDVRSYSYSPDTLILDDVTYTRS